MASYLVTTYKITNPEGYSAYTATVGATVFAHGGKILVASAALDELATATDHGNAG